MNDIIGTIIRFTSATETVDVTVDQDKATVRDLLSMLPLDDLTFRDNGGLEKVSHLPRKLDENSPASGLCRGTLIYFTGWGSLGFWYTRMPFPARKELLHIGRFETTKQRLAFFESGTVRAERV